MIKALVFDFDGLILETESPIYQTWADLFASFGHTLALSDWLTTIGTQEAAFNPVRELERLVGKPLDWDEIEAARKAREMAIINAQPVLPGVVDYLTDAQRLGLKIGLASSSSNRWIISHLSRLNLLHYFDVLRTHEHVELTKPDPALYRSVLEHMQIPPAQALALEDSTNGVLAAKRAGMFCVAVPNSLTQQLDLSEADICLHSLDEIRLEDLLQKLPG